MFFNLTIDMILLLGAGLSLLLWFRFNEGARVSSLFRNVFFVCLFLFIGSLLFRYSGLMNNGGEWLVSASQVILLGLGSLFIGLSRKKSSLLLSGLAMMIGLFIGKSFLDKIAMIYVDVPEVSQEGELLVKTMDGLAPDKDETIFHKYDLNAKRAFVDKVSSEHELDNYFLVDIPLKNEPQILKIKSELESAHAYVVVEWNEEMKIEASVTKIQKNKDIKTWANDPQVSNQWYYDMLQMDEVHRYLNIKNIKPKETAHLFILDSGVDAKHEDINGNYFSVKPSYDNDSNGHGTHCAGIAAAVTNNGKGIASMIPNSSFIDVTGIKVMSALGVGTQKTIIRGIVEAVEAGADVISMSLGGVSSDSKQRAYREAFEYAAHHNVTIVVAAGNSDDEASRYTPANVPGVICVSAVDQTGKKSFFSNYMDDIAMPLSAPGTDIYSTMPNNKYAALSGTSMSAPFVSSMVALIKSIDPDMSTDEIFYLLHNTGIDTQSDKMIGRLIQPYEAIKMLKTNSIAKNTTPISSFTNQQD